MVHKKVDFPPEADNAKQKKDSYFAANHLMPRGHGRNGSNPYKSTIRDVYTYEQRGFTERDEERDPFIVEQWKKIYLKSIAFSYAIAVCVMILTRVFYHYQPSTLLLMTCVLNYCVVIMLGTGLLKNPTVRNIDPTIWKHFGRNPNVIVVFSFAFVYLLQVMVYNFSMLLDDTEDRFFKVVTAGTEIFVLFHGLLLDAAIYVPNSTKGFIIIINLLASTFCSIIMFADPTEHPLIIPPEFRVADLYSGTMTTIVIMYASMAFNHFIRQDGRCAIVTKHLLIEKADYERERLIMWVPVALLGIYVILAFIPAIEHSIAWRIPFIVLFSLALYVCVFRKNFHP